MASIRPVHNNSRIEKLNQAARQGKRTKREALLICVYSSQLTAHKQPSRQQQRVIVMAGAEVSEPIFGKKFMSQLGGMANESAAAGVSDFARRQMEKMGWREGKGLGKEEQGVVTHVKVKKREEFMGVGVEKLKVEEQKNQWWYNAYDKIADKIKIAPDTDDEDASASGSSKKKTKKKASKKKRKRDAEAAASASANDGDSAAREKKFRIPTDEELFAATGGKLFGRRAYGSCNGKLKRDQLLQSGKFEIKQSKKEKKKKSSDEAKDSGANSTTSSSDDDEEEGDAEKKRKDKKKQKKKAKAAKKQAAKDKSSGSGSDSE